VAFVAVVEAAVGIALEAPDSSSMWWNRLEQRKEVDVMAKRAAVAVEDIAVMTCGAAIAVTVGTEFEGIGRLLGAFA